MKWGLSCRASKMLSNGPTLRSLSIFHTEFSTILCCSVAVFGREQQLQIGSFVKNSYFCPRVATDPNFFCEANIGLGPVA